MSFYPFDLFDSSQAQNMIQEVKDAFKNNLPMLKWMDRETRELAKEKVGDDSRRARAVRKRNAFVQVSKPRSLILAS